MDNAKNKIISELEIEVKKLQNKNKGLQEQIKGFEQRIEECNNLETQIADLKELLEHRMNRIRNLDSQHQSDCIRINELTVALDTLVDRYANLRKIHGVG